jgi:hypothetical protein
MAYVDQVTNRQGQAAGSQGVDLRQRQNRKSLFGPVDATAAFLRSGEFQDYANPEQGALTDAVEGIFSGGRSASRQAMLNASRLGLGRGAAAQMQTDIQRGQSGQVAEATLGAKLLGQDRRMQGSEMLMNAIRQSQQAAAMRRMMHRQSSMTSLLQGNFASSLGAGLGSYFGGLPGAGTMGLADSTLESADTIPNINNFGSNIAANLGMGY